MGIGELEYRYVQNYGYTYVNRDGFIVDSWGQSTGQHVSQYEPR